MFAPDLARARWRKSSRSGNGANCVEVAPVADWRKSARSGNGAACVEVAPANGWRKSTRSANGAEVAPVRQVIAVRDSKNPDGPKLAFSRDTWRAFLARAKSDDLDL